MAYGDDPQFDSLLISTATILRRAAAVSTANYGQPTSSLPTTVAAGIPCRVSSGKGTEWKYDKKVATGMVRIYMNVYTSPWTLEEKDWIEVEGTRYDIQAISDPSLAHHHWEIDAEVYIP